MQAAQNELITRVGPGRPAGALLRNYWQPAALAEELDGPRPVKAVRLMGEDLSAAAPERQSCGRALSALK